eukprot:gene7485-11809_t
MSWDECKKQTVFLENEIDKKLLNFSKLNINSYSDEISMENLNSSQQLFDSMQIEIEEQLTQLKDSIDKLSSILNQSQDSKDYNINSILLQRHREIYHDYSQTYKKTKNSVSNSRNRAQLLSGGDTNTSGLSARTSNLLKEKDHLINIDRLTKNTLDNALEARERMGQQDKAMKNSRGTMTGMVSRFTFLNSVLGNISLRRKRDAIIIGVFIAICIIILFFLWK